MMFLDMLGKNIKNARTKKMLSLQELANMVQVTPGFLSQIENDKNQPSLSTLRKIAKCLDITVSRLLGEAETSNQMLVRARERRVIRNLADGAMSLEFLSAFDPKNTMEVCLHNLAPRGKSNAAPNSHEGQEALYVLKGSMKMIVDGKAYQMDEGDCFMLNDCMLAHQFANLSDTENAQMLVVASPPCFCNHTPSQYAENDEQ